MRLDESLRFIWGDRRWLEKSAVGVLFTLFSLILIGIPVLAGYWLEIVRQAARGPLSELPEWTDLGKKFMDGLGVVVIFIVWQLPVWLSSGVAGLWAGFLNQRAGDNFLIAAVILCVQCLVWLLSIVLWALMAAALIRYATHDRLAEAFNVRGVLDLIRERPARFIGALVASWVVSLISLFGLLLCFVGIFLTGFWAACVSGNLYGQVIRPEAEAPAPVEAA